MSLGVNNIVVHAADVPTTQKEHAFKTDKLDPQSRGFQRIECQARNDDCQ